MRYGRFTVAGEPASSARLGVQADDNAVLDLTALHADRPVPWPELLVAPSLDRLLAAGRSAWLEVHRWLRETLADAAGLAPFQHPVDRVTPALAFTVADYVDFFACEQHAVNAARIFRPNDEPLTPNWKHLPIGYHGRSSTIRGSGSPVRRPNGQRGPGDFGPTRALDFEAELGFVLGGASTPGEPVPMTDAEDPLLGKAFATSISNWVTPWPELAAAQVAPPPRDPEPLPYLRGDADKGLDLAVEVRLNGELITSPPAADLYWTGAQFIAHLTSGGATLSPGDLLGSGTMSGPERNQRGCLLELSWGGREPLPLTEGGELTYLRDGDELVITASAAAVGGGRLSLGEV